MFAYFELQLRIIENNKGREYGGVGGSILKISKVLGGGGHFTLR